MSTVMIVDDSPTIRMSIGMLLEGNGFTVTSAGDGDEALRKLAEEDPPAAIITDLNMPAMSGLEFTRLVRLDSRLRSTPVLLLTVESDRERRAELRSAGLTGWLVKPVKNDDLIHALHQVVPV